MLLQVVIYRAEQVAGSSPVPILSTLTRLNSELMIWMSQAPNNHTPVTDLGAKLPYLQCDLFYAVIALISPCK